MQSLMLTANLFGIFNLKVSNYITTTVKKFCEENNIKYIECGANSLESLGLNLKEFPTAYYNISGFPNDQHYRFLRYLELNKVKYINSVNSEIVADDKMLSYLELKYNGIEVVDTISLGQIFDNSQDNIIEQIEDLIGYPCVIKPTKLGHGMGVVKCDNKYQLSEILGLIFATDSRKYGSINYNNFIVQKFVLSTFGQKYRFVLFKDTPLVWVHNRNTQGYWKVNYVTTTEREVSDPPNSIVDLGIKIHDILNLNFSGMDFHVCQDKFIINEINPIPSLEILDKIYNKKIIEYVLKNLFINN